MNKKFKAWLTPEEFGPDARLCVAFEMPIGSNQFTVKTVPAKMVSEIGMFSTTADNSVMHELRMSAAQDGDPYLPISNEHVLLGRFRTQKEAASALGAIQRAVGYGRFHTRRLEGIGFLAAGFIIASVVFGVISTGGSSTSLGSQNVMSETLIPYLPDESEQEISVSQEEPVDGAQEEAFYRDVEPGSISAVAKALLGNKGGVFQVGDGEPLAIVMSDPMCPSCKQTKNLFDEVKLPYLVAPVGKLSPESIRTAMKILCANDKPTFYSNSFDDRSLEIDTKDPAAVQSCGDALLRNNELFDRTLSRGVPTFIRMSDNVLRPEGFDSADALKEWLTNK